MPGRRAFSVGFAQIINGDGRALGFKGQIFKQTLGGVHPEPGPDSQEDQGRDEEHGHEVGSILSSVIEMSPEEKRERKKEGIQLGS